MAAPVHIFGIRHHGPGSALRLVEALEALQPAIVLIEGPADATELLPFLPLPTMVPPVALLAYATDNPARAIFWPFAEYSPEYQAVLWASRNGAVCRFIDLPSSWTLAEPATADEPEVAEGTPVPASPIDEAAARCSAILSASWRKRVATRTVKAGGAT